MIPLARDFRLIPVVLVAIICLFALKTFGLIFNGGYTLNELAAHGRDDVNVTGSIAATNRVDVILANAPNSGAFASQKNQAAAKPATGQSWAQQMFNFPDITGSAGAAKPAEKAPAAPPAKGDRPAAKPPEPVVELAPAMPSRAERAILERLQERRIELDARARDLEMRESLLKAAEKRLEGRLVELKEVETRASAAVTMKDEAEAARFKNLVSMYDNMKAKDAAKIFDRLDIKVLLDVATQINPRRMSDILAQMSPEAAERLTVELAARARDRAPSADLPKIEGRPMSN